MNNQNTFDSHWTENIIIADADYVDRVAFNLIVNFERIIGRRIPQADLAQWAECVALDGGMRPVSPATAGESGGQQVHVIFVHDKETVAMENFQPGDLKKQIDAKAFSGPLGEFTLSAINAEGMATKEDLFVDTLRFVASQHDVKRIMVVPDERLFDDVRDALRHVDDDSKRITLFAMEPMPGGNFRQEILGYSLMQALGIRGDEIK